MQVDENKGRFGLLLRVDARGQLPEPIFVPVETGQPIGILAKNHDLEIPAVIAEAVGRK
jgi:hypothetical protein